MHSLSPDYLARLRFDTQQLATLRALGEYRGVDEGVPPGSQARTLSRRRVRGAPS